MKMVPLPDFGSLLRLHRRAAGLTQEALAERAGLSVDEISILERGISRAPHRATVDLLAEALQLSPAERARFAAFARGHLTLLEGPPGESDRSSPGQEGAPLALAPHQRATWHALPVPPTPL